MTTNYHHGVRATDHTIGPARIRVGEAGEIGIIGTAPDADANIWPLNIPVAILGDITKADSLGDAGTLKPALKAIWKQYGTQSGKIVVVRVDENVTPATQISLIVGDATTKTGVHAFKNAKPMLDIEPDILIAPGFANAAADAQASAVVAELIAVAEPMRAFVFFDGPNTTSADAVTARQNYGSDRAIMSDPYVTVWDIVTSADVQLPSSAILAGIQSSLDLEKGFWWSYDNKKIRGITGMARPIDWRLNDPNSEATSMNSDQISTLYRDKGFYTWGGETLDSERKMGGTIGGRRVADKLYDALETDLKHMIGQPLSLQSIRHIASLGKGFLRELQQKGALIDYTFTLPEHLNSVAQLSEGIIFYELKFVEAVAIRDIEIWGYRTPELYAEFLEEAAAVSAQAA